VSGVSDAPDLHESDDAATSERYRSGANAGGLDASSDGELPQAGRPSHPAATVGGRRSLIELLLLVVLVVLAAVTTHATDLLVVIVVLIVMIMLHELGHFVTAKWSGMKVTEYFLGFGPRVWSFRRGETEYGVKAIPAGGYVRIIGMANTEEVDPEDEPRTYRAKPFHNRLAVGLAGSFMHFVLAFVILWGALVFLGWPNQAAVSIQGYATIAGHQDPARSAGIEPGDTIVRADGRAVTSVDEFAQVISSHAGKPVTVVVERGGTRRTLVVTPHALTVPAATAHQAPTVVGRIGVVLTNPLTTIGPIAAVERSGALIGQVVSGSVSAVGQRFSLHGLTEYFHEVTNAQAARQASKSGQRIESIYGAVRTATQGAQAGAWYFISVMISLIIFVGLLNLLPMLPLDGGHVAIAVYERIRSRRGRQYRADVSKLMPVAYAFVLFLGFIVVTSFYLDVAYPIANPFK